VRTKHRSLVERGGRKALLAHTKKKRKKKCQEKKTVFTNLKKQCEHIIELTAKLLNHFLRSNKSNINLAIFSLGPAVAIFKSSHER